MITNQFTTQPFTPHQWERTEDGFLRVRARVLAERVMPYSPTELTELPMELQQTEVIPMLVDLQSMSTGECFRTLESAQVVAPEHIWVTPENDYVSKGNAVGSPAIEGPYLCIDLLVTEPKTITGIETREIGEISAGYHADTIFEPGEFDGTPYLARQTKLRFNHIAIIPQGTGRAGSDVRIVNQKKEIDMADEKAKIRVQLRNTKRFVNTDEEGAAAIAAEEESSAGEGKKLEALMKEAEEAKAAAEAANAELETLKGELSVYKEKLDELLSTEALEHAAGNMAEEMVAEQGEAEEIIENCPMQNEKGEDDEKKREEVMNSLKGLRGAKLHAVVLTAIGAKVENMSPEALKGAFKAQHQIANTMKGRYAVVGAKMMNKTRTETVTNSQPVVRTPMERLGFPKK